VDARIPHDYIDSDRLRLEAYQKLSQASAPNAKDEDIDRVVDELTDRYGDIPLPLETLVMVTRLRRQSRKAGLSEVLVMGSKLRVVGPPLPDSMKVRVARLYPAAHYLAPARVLLVPLPGHSDQALVTWVSGIIDALYQPAAAPVASETLES
jgi:transcription-repair coupling factor (superfamily II helicase)